MSRDRASALLLDFSGVADSAGSELASFVREVSEAGHPVALAADGAAPDLAAFGLADAVTAVVDSGRPGSHKPSREFFAAACEALGTPPERCLFVDDEDRNIRGARVAGLSAYRWNGPADLPYLRAALGL